MNRQLPPYPEIRETGLPWIRSCPSHWQLRRMKFLFHERVEKGYPDEPLLTASQSRGVIPKAEYGSRTVEAVKDLHLLKLVEPGDYVISLRSFQGGIEFAHVRGIISPAYTVLEPKGDVRRGYYEHFFKSADFINSMTLFVTGIREGQNIDYVRLSRAYMPVPPPEEQDAIGRFLRHLDQRVNQLIKTKRRLIELLNEQKQAIIHRAVTQGLDATITLKPSGIDWLGNVPAHWDVKPLKSIFREIDERTTTGDEEILSVSHLTGVTPRSQKNITMFMAESYVGHKMCRAGDLVANTMWMWMGALGVSEVEGILSPSYAIYRPKANAPVHGAFLDMLTRTRLYIDEYTKHSTGIRPSRLRLYPEQFLRMPVLLPPLQEQVLICDHLREATQDIVATIGKANGEIDLIREYRTRLVAEVVTGQLDVRHLELPEVGESLTEAIDTEDDEHIEALDEQEAEE